MVRLLAVLVLALPADALAGDCFAPASADQLDAVLARAEAAWAEGDTAGFRASVQEATAFVVPCLAEPALPEVAARLHRARALVAYSERRKDDAVASMHAARVLDPDLQLPDAILPPGHELRDAYEHAPPTGGTERVAAARGGTLWFDGTAATYRPTDRPTLAQLDLSGRITESTVLEPGEPLFAYPHGPPRLRTGLAIAAGVAAAAGGALFGAGVGTASTYWAADDPLHDPDLGALRSTANGLQGAGIALGVVALGSGVGAAVVGPR